MVTRIIAFVSLFVIGLTLTILVMIYGWGLEPKSWWWIIGGGIAGRILLGILEIITKQEGKS
jgi:hypothetical protein